MTNFRFTFFTGLLLFLSLIVNAQPWLVGVCAEGGYQFGTIINYVAGDTSTDVYRLTGTVGSNPKLSSCVDVNGKVYGMTTEGGVSNGGIIYEYDYNTGIYQKKFDLHINTGSYGTGAMVPGNNGFLYGVTYLGGMNSYGVIFEYDYLNNIYVKKREFSTTTGISPTGSMLLASNNKFYGMTTSGGTGSKGVIYEYDHINNIYTKKYDFSGSDGKNPRGALIEAPNGKLYGMTNFGGLNDMGVIFEYDFTSDIFIKKIDLDSINGSRPYGSLLLASNGKMYAMTSEGGVDNAGVLFEYDYINNSYTKKIDLGLNHRGPRGNLMIASNGLMYGMTYYGGTFGAGVIFEYDFNTNTLTDKIDLNPTLGNYPSGSLIEASNGLLYGSTDGSTSRGAFFEYDYINNSYSKIKEFSKANAIFPTAAPIQAPNGKLYGISSKGAANGYGSIYEYDYPSSSFTHKFDFTTSFQTPQGGLLLASNGKFYGNGGASGNVFEYDYFSNTCTIKATSIGGRPNGSMIEATNGRFYGLTYNGGSSNAGTLFEFDPVTNVISQMHAFDTTNGLSPYFGLIQASNGKLYGVTSWGGSTYSPGISIGKGTMFEYDYSSDTFIKRVDFTDSIGWVPAGSLIQASNGKLYGMTGAGGGNNDGVIYEYDPVTNIYTKKIDMVDSIGGIATGALFEASNGKLYGMTRIGGAGRGVIFEYDFNTNVYSKKVDMFESITGYNPQNSFGEFQCLAPLISASGPISFCRGSNVILNADVDSSSTIQWYRNTIAIPGATNNSLLVTTAGTYTVTVSNSLCPPLTSSFIKVRIPCIPPFDEAEKIYGNEITNDHFSFDAFYDPTSENLNLTSYNVNGNHFTVAVFDQTGKLILNEKGSITNGEFSKQLDLSPFASGMYIVRFTTEREHGMQRFFK